jgi:hypothetical protein
MRKVHILALALFLAGCTTSRVDLNHEPTAERLRKIPVVAMEFEDSAMSDVVAYLAMSMHCVCHPMVYPTQTIGDDIVTYVIPFDTFDGEDPDCPKSLLRGTNETPLVRLGPAITLRIRNGTMLDVVEEVTKQSQGSTVIGEDEITIRTKKVQAPVAHVQEGPLPDPF